MESLNKSFKNVQRPVASGQQQSRDQLDWARFILGKRTVYWLLVLLTIYTISAPVVVALIIKTELGRRTIVIGALMTGGIASVVRLLSNSLKLILAHRD